MQIRDMSKSGLIRPHSLDLTPNTTQYIDLSEVSLVSTHKMCREEFQSSAFNHMNNGIQAGSRTVGDKVNLKGTFMPLEWCKMIDLLLCISKKPQLEALCLNL